MFKLVVDTSVTGEGEERRSRIELQSQLKNIIKKLQISYFKQKQNQENSHRM